MKSTQRRKPRSPRHGRHRDRYADKRPSELDRKLDLLVAKWRTR